MPQRLLTIAQTAERLKVRPDYVRELVRKKRLTFVEGEQLPADQVDALAELMNKLRGQGIAAMVQIADAGGDLTA